MDIHNTQAKITLEQFIAHKQRRNPIIYSIYGIIRLLIVIIQNIYSVTSYFILSWILFLPFIWLKNDIYTKLENYLYNSLLFIVSSWSIPAGVCVVEAGDEFKHLIEGEKLVKPKRIVKPEDNYNNHLKLKYIDSNSSSDIEVKESTHDQTKACYLTANGDTSIESKNLTNEKKSNELAPTQRSNNTDTLISNTDTLIRQSNGLTESSDESTNLVKVSTIANNFIVPQTPPNNHLNLPIKEPPNTKLSANSKVNIHSTANPRILLLCNHISTADVPLLMQAFSPLTKQSLLWILDAQFKLTNFGLVSWSHEDFFIAKNKFVDGSLKEHLQKHPERNLIILFPEGGFWRKRIDGSNRFANRNNLPITKYVTHPRFGAFNDLIDPSLNVTHIVDATLMYDNLKNPMSILDIITGWRKEPVLLKYKVYDRISTVVDEQWLRSIWLEKDKLLHRYYTDRNSVYEQIEDGLRIIKLDWIKVIIVHLFYMLVFYLVVYKIVNY